MTTPSIARDPAGSGPNSAQTTAAKSALRGALLARRQALAGEARRAADARLTSRVLDWCQAHDITRLGVYLPIRGEPDLGAAWPAFLARGGELALPVVIDRQAPLAFRRWRPGDVLIKDALGMPVPPPQAQTVTPQALLIPCLGFTREGVRLGYGGGFYDRTMAASPRPLAVGVSYGCGLAEFAAQPHDIPMDLVLTDA